MIEDIIKAIEGYSADAIVIEGYDGVGKGKILSEISEHYGVTPYRPDYNLWQLFDHRKVDRWKVSGFFWDIYSHFNYHNQVPMLFDRGVISGAVYNDDMTIAEHYKEMLRDMKVMHILITCLPGDYPKFCKARNPEISEEEIAKEWKNYEKYTDRYKRALDIAGVDYLVYINKYDDSTTHDTCSSCGHYSYGSCRHPAINCRVDGNHKRCDFSNEREVQDIDSEMYSLQS